MPNRNTIAIVGISPRNSYYSEANIRFAITQAARDYPHVIAMVADYPALSTWMALGYSAQDATRKARLDGNNLRNRCKRATKEIVAAVDIIEWNKHVETDRAYQQERAAMQKRFEQQAAFRDAVRDVTKHVLAASKRGQNCDEATIDKAADYVLSELAFIEATHRKHGAPVDFIYHRAFPLLDAYSRGQLDDIARPYINTRRVTAEIT